jgi:hypothetical protein
MALAASLSDAVVAAPVPPGAIETIARVNRAATRNDFAALRATMVQDFRWSFGGDASADQAIAEWKKEPRYLRQLARITKGTCTRHSDGEVECPARAGTSSRAGFMLRDGQWTMTYFIEGD